MKVLFSTFGSAGDLFPLVPIARALLAEGDEVRFLVPRSLTLYLRVLGIPSVAYGDAREMRFSTDEHLFTTRFDGWHSVREVYTRYVAPTLVDDVRTAVELVEAWKPDTVVTLSYATPARAAARWTATPLLPLSIYPQHARLRPGSPFGEGYQRRADGVPEIRSLDEEQRHLVLWGEGAPTRYLFDPWLARYGADEVPCLGFPYWDDLPVPEADVEDVRSWMERSADPVVVVTLGSFTGIATAKALEDAVAATRHEGVRLLLVGPDAGATHDLEGGDRVKTARYVPLSNLMPHAHAVVHHGGLGTTMCALRSQVAAAVVPHAFDQPFMGRLVARSGAGLCGVRSDLARMLAEVQGDPSYRERARHVGEHLTSSREATRRAVDAVRAVAEVGVA